MKESSQKYFMHAEKVWIAEVWSTQRKMAVSCVRVTVPAMMPTMCGDLSFDSTVTCRAQRKSLESESKWLNIFFFENWSMGITIKQRRKKLIDTQLDQAA